MNVVLVVGCWPVASGQRAFALCGVAHYSGHVYRNWRREGMLISAKAPYNVFFVFSGLGCLLNGEIQEDPH